MPSSTDSSDSNWPLPSAVAKADGAPRQLGVELEFQGLTVVEISDIVAATLGGQIEEVSSAERIVHVEGHGDYRVEVDFALLKKAALNQKDSASGSTIESLAIDALGAVSNLVVPCEIVCPPLPLPDAAEPLEQLVRQLRNAGAQGTRRSVMYAFGVHLNVEPPALDAATLLAFMQAYVCLHDWIIWRDDIDLARRLLPYVDRYPAPYEEKIAHPAYSPDMSQLQDDYYAATPTRNRALDMLPLWAHLDEEKLRASIDDPLVNARPAFHYRLANCCVDEAQWSLATPWSHWLAIESLAADHAARRRCMAAFQEDRRRTLSALDSQWRDAVEQFLPG